MLNSLPNDTATGSDRTPAGLRIAIVGAGIAGLTAAHYLSRRHDVRLFEANAFAGGHTNTVDVEIDGRSFAVDTGFIVFNDRNYPNFTKLLDELGVERQPTTMSFSVKCERTGLEYNPTSPRALFAQKRNLVQPRFYRMLADIVRFGKQTQSSLDALPSNLTLGELVGAGEYSDWFVDKYLVPMGAALWSARPEQMLSFPAATFARFFDNHGMLVPGDRPNWFVVKGGSRQYVRRIVNKLTGRVHLNSAVTSVKRLTDGVELTIAGRAAERFDRVVLALHSDQALRILDDPTPAERDLLGSIAYQENQAVLHTDPRTLPKRRRAWASWNYHIPKSNCDRVAVTYNMNHLQSIPFDTMFNVTLNYDDKIVPEHVLQRIKYHHPVFTTSAINAQKRKHTISGLNSTYYCGAYWGYGFHEDGVKSALDVCTALGMQDSEVQHA